MFLSTIGMTQISITESSSKLTADQVAITGLCGITVLSYANILARTPNAALNTTKGPRSWVDSPFTHGKLNIVKLSALPDNKASERSGRWGMVFIPFRDDKDEAEIKTSYRALTLQRIQGMAGCVTGAADRPLSLVFRPKPEDGYVFRYNQIGSTFGALILAYSEEMRVTYHDFSANDFSPNITVTGTLSLRQPVLNGGVVGYEDSMWSAAYGATIRSTADNRDYHFSSDSYTCVKSSTKSGTCKITANAYSPPSLEGFEYMHI
jgi:hypothetical protein